MQNIYRKDFSSSLLSRSQSISNTLTDINLDLTYDLNNTRNNENSLIMNMKTQKKNESGLDLNKEISASKKNSKFNNFLFTNKIKNQKQKQKQKFYFDNTQLNLLEKFFENVENEKDLKETFEIFEEIYEDHMENEELLYLCFWISFINSKEIICEEILNKTKIKFFNGIEIDKLESINFSSNELNNYAFNIAYKNNFQEKLLFYVLKKGKIKLPIEFLYKKLSENSLELIEVAWKAGNSCFFSTPAMKDLFIEIFKEEIESVISDRIIKAQLFASLVNSDNVPSKGNNKGRIDDSENENRNIKGVDKSKNNYKEEMLLRNNLVNLAVNLIKNVDIKNDLVIDEEKKKKITLKLEESKRKAENVNEVKKRVESEFLDLFVNNFGKLTLTKLLIFAHCLEEEELTKEIQEQQRKQEKEKAEKQKQEEIKNINNKSPKKKIPKFLAGIKKKEISTSTTSKSYTLNNINKSTTNAAKDDYKEEEVKDQNENQIRKTEIFVAQPKRQKNFSSLNRSICLFDKEKKYSAQLLIGLFICKNNKIAIELLEANFIKISSEAFKISLFFRDANFSLLFYTLYSDFKIFAEDELHMQILEYSSSSSEDSENLELYLYFIRMFESFFKISTTKTLLKIIEELLQINNPSNKIIQNFANPIKIFVLLAEILNILKLRFPILEYSMSRLIDKCLEYSKNLQLMIQDDNLFREIILEKDIANRAILDIISQNDFLILLENKLVEKIVDDLWNGPYSLEASLFETSSNYKALLVKAATKDYDVYTKQRDARKINSSEAQDKIAIGSNTYGKLISKKTKLFDNNYNKENYKVNSEGYQNGNFNGVNNNNKENNNNKKKKNKDCCAVFNFDFRGDNTFKANITNFKVWRNNVYLKFYVEVIISILIAVFLQYVSLSCIYNYKLLLNFGKNPESNSDYLTSDFALDLNEITKCKELIINKSNFSLENYLNKNFNYSDLIISNRESDFLVKFNLTEYEILKSNKIFFIFNEPKKAFSENELENLKKSEFEFSKLLNLLKALETEVDLLNKFFYLFYFLICDYALRLIFHIKSKKPSFGLTLYFDILLILVIFVFDRLFKSDAVENFYKYIDFNKIFLNFKEISESKFENEANLIQNNFNYLQTQKDFFFVFQFQQILIFFINNDPYTNNFILYSILCLILWLRLILLLRGTKTFGPIIVIFLISLKGIFTYIFIFLLFNLFICCFGFLFFYNVNLYTNKNIFYSFFYYFLLSLGGDPLFESYTDATLQKSKPYIEYISGLFIIFIVVVNSVIFVNLIIALLANIYDLYRTYSIQLFIQKKLEIRKKFYSDDKRFDSLLVNVFPFNFFIFPFALFFLFIKNDRKAKRLNYIILLVNYSFYAFFYLFYYAIATMLFTPLAFVKILYSKFTQIFVNEIQQYFTIYKIFSITLYLAFGILVQLYAFVSDIKLFILELLYVKKRIPLLNEEENFRKFNLKKSLVDILIKIFKNNSQKINRISLENLLGIIIRCLDADFSESEIIVDLKKFDLDDPNIMKDYEESFGNFNVYNNKFCELFYRKKINYEEFLDFLANFYDENFIVSVNVFVNVLIISKLSEKRNEYFKMITDKNFCLDQGFKQTGFLEKVKKFYFENSPSINNIIIDNDKEIKNENYFNEVAKGNSFVEKKLTQSFKIESPKKVKFTNYSNTAIRENINSFDFENSIFNRSVINNINKRDAKKAKNINQNNSRDINLNNKEGIFSKKNTLKTIENNEASIEINLSNSELNVNTDLRFNLSPIKSLNKRSNLKGMQPFDISLLNSLQDQKLLEKSPKNYENISINPLDDFNISLLNNNSQKDTLEKKQKIILDIKNKSVGKEKQESFVKTKSISERDKQNAESIELNKLNLQKNLSIPLEEITEEMKNNDAQKPAFSIKNEFLDSIRTNELKENDDINNNKNNYTKEHEEIEDDNFNIETDRNFLQAEKENKQNKPENNSFIINSPIYLNKSLRDANNRKLTIIQEKDEFVGKNNENSAPNEKEVKKPNDERRGTIIFKKVNTLKLKSFKTLFGKKFIENLKDFNQQEKKNTLLKNGDTDTKSNKITKSLEKLASNKNNNISNLAENSSLNLYSQNLKNKKQKKEKEESIYLKIPVISRTSISIFINDLKEYQTDLSKKISDSLAKNQKYLSDLSKSNNKHENEFDYILINKQNEKKIEELNKKIDEMRNEFQVFMQKTSLFYDENFKSLIIKNYKNNSDVDKLTVKELKDQGDTSPAYQRKFENKNKDDLAVEEYDSEKTLVFNFNENIVFDNDKNLRGYLKEKTKNSQSGN